MPHVLTLTKSTFLQDNTTINFLKTQPRLRVICFCKNYMSFLRTVTPPPRPSFFYVYYHKEHI